LARAGNTFGRGLVRAGWAGRMEPDAPQRPYQVGGHVDEPFHPVELMSKNFLYARAHGETGLPTSHNENPRRPPRLLVQGQGWIG
jgi:hypothetical protein